MLVLLVYVPVLLVVLVIWWYAHWSKYSGILKGVPGPPPIPIVGHGLLFPNSASVLPKFLELFQTYGRRIKLIIGTEPSINISDCEGLEAVLGSNSLVEKSTQYRHLVSWLGRGLLTSGGSKWRRRRKIITPTYHFRILEEFVPVFESMGDVLVEQMSLVAGESVDVYPLVTFCTLDIICETAMGTSVNAQINRNSEYVRCVKEMCRIVMEKTFSPLQQFEALYRFTDNCRKERQCLKVLNDYTMSVIRKRRAQMMNAGPDEVDDEFGSKRRTAFLDLLLRTTLEDGQGLSDGDIMEEVATFMFEGHDTTASAISFALYLIANHPEVQRKVVEEQTNIFGNIAKDKITYRDLQEMKYLEMVIKETLRLYPSVPLFAREVREEVKINDDLVLPVGLTVNIFVFGAHRDPDVFPEPEVFRPERFAVGSTSRNPYSYVPFSAGPRNCIGQKFALLEMKTVLSKIVGRFELSPAVPEHHPNLVAEIILKSSNGIRVGLKRR